MHLIPFADDMVVCLQVGLRSDIKKDLLVLGHGCLPNMGNKASLQVLCGLQSQANEVKDRKRMQDGHSLIATSPATWVTSPVCLILE